ncbi:TetR/AcrR family transcriptional regulator [Streptomyces sp. GXMU-J15]|uniref:TetR/AcrR family transcriptional regulator n=1 Tax=Streptomyces fuscus TaxID=3048495 RepID=A0ABT7JB20_9ACTN|nr:MULTISPECIES: TetR/AcrR family transcriptional regulator [Streptomyces]MDL2082068.1 TetR/AcrR family transcriptional regulator [Streptomyces fuscus]SBT95355.1 transcriptional regulator, TetR family [Streptomyces sp. DI166]
MTVEEPQPARSPGRRERSRQRMHDRLYTSALELFAEQGYERTTIDQITERADVARGTFFNHFQRKEDLVTTWAQQRQEKLQAFMEKSLDHEGDDTTVQLERCMSALADFNEAERDLTKVMLTAWVKSGQPLLEEPEYAGHIFVRIISAGQARGDVALDIDPVAAGNMLRDAYLGLLYRWTQVADEKVPLHIELRALLRIALTGIASYSKRGWTGS